MDIRKGVEWVFRAALSPGADVCVDTLATLVAYRLGAGVGGEASGFGKNKRPAKKHALPRERAESRPRDVLLSFPSTF